MLDIRFKMIIQDGFRLLPKVAILKKTHKINYHAQVELIHMRKIYFRGGNRLVSLFLTLLEMFELTGLIFGGNIEYI